MFNLFIAAVVELSLSITICRFALSWLFVLVLASF